MYEVVVPVTYLVLCPNPAHLQHTRLQNLTVILPLQCNLSRSLKAKYLMMLCNSSYMVPINVLQSHVVPNSGLLLDMTSKLSNLDLSRSFKVTCDGAVGLPMHGFLLMWTKFRTPKPTLTLACCDFSQNLIISSLDQMEG